MEYNTCITDLAYMDLEKIKEYLWLNESEEIAELVVDKIYREIQSLRRFPERHGHPIELLQRRNKRFREKLCGSYRIIYRIDKSNVFIMLVIHASRNAVPIFKERLLNI